MFLFVFENLADTVVYRLATIVLVHVDELLTRVAFEVWLESALLHSGLVDLPLQPLFFLLHLV